MVPTHAIHPIDSHTAFPLASSHLRSRSTSGTSGSSSWVTDIGSQFRNPNDILSVLLIIGGDIVQKALAQVSSTGPAPVCFSFGWVSYSFISLVNLLGDGRLMPTPDYPCKIINLETGYYRENKSWLIGRLMRDNEASMTKKLKRKHRVGQALRIAIYDPSSHIPKNLMRPVHVTTTALQLGIAVIPGAMYGDWSPLLVTAAGTSLATLMGLLPQWKAEKFPTTRKSNKLIAITAGNGSKDVVIVRGSGSGMDLERLAAAEGPRGTRPWERWGFFKRCDGDETRVRTWNGLPVDFWFTRLICTLLAVCWLLLLIFVAGVMSNTWYLLIIGAMGMFQNAFVAGVSINPEGHPIPLLCKELIYGNKVMDALMDLEVKLEEDEAAGGNPRSDIVRPLLKEFFPGELKEAEIKWWGGDRDGYDEKRIEEMGKRGEPRSLWDSARPRTFTSEPATVGETSMAAAKRPAPDLDNRIPAVSDRRASEATTQHEYYEDPDLDVGMPQLPPGMA